MPHSYQDPSGCIWTEHYVDKGYVFYFNESTQAREYFEPPWISIKQSRERAHARLCISFSACNGFDPLDGALVQSRIHVAHVHFLLSSTTAV